MAGYDPSGRTALAKHRKSLDAVFDRAAAIDPASELAGDLTRYLCVRVSGYLEQALLELGRSACNQRSSGIGLEFALSGLQRAPNPGSADVVRFMRRFSANWGDELEELLKDDERRSRLNALVGIRNDIAHGKNQGVSLHQALEYYLLVVEIADWFADRLEPLPGKQPASPP